jgi:hypothetical protein
VQARCMFVMPMAPVTRLGGGGTSSACAARAAQTPPTGASTKQPRGGINCSLGTQGPCHGGEGQRKARKWEGEVMRDYSEFHS